MTWASVIALVFFAAPLSGVQNNTVSLEQANTRPRVVNGGFTERAFNGSLVSAMSDIARSVDAAVWAGYAVPARSTRTDSFDGCCSNCRLEGRGYAYSNTVTGASVLMPDLFVFVRFEKGMVTRVRPFDSACTIDATGTTVIWLTGVPPTESLAYLQSLAGANNGRNISSSAIAAIALHGDPVADMATAALIRMAHDGPVPAVRGEALFWMAQEAGSRIAGEIAASVDNDPDTEVKKRAVFALAQIPNGDGIPKLIEVARSNRNAAARKQAVFWLGQSRDPRALKFIEDVLTH
jgi:hypothetical protein